MAGFKKELAFIAVTGGDAISSNRLHGKSNTGTYFVCSQKSWDEFSPFFNDKEPFIYKLDLTKIKIYKNLFVSLFFNRKKLYKDEMCHFEDICDSLMLYDENPPICFELRINGPRIFLRFLNNQNEVEYALRGIIYSDLTNLVFDKESRTFYLEVNSNEVDNQDHKEDECL